jgi:hypothetical protein
MKHTIELIQDAFRALSVPGVSKTVTKNATHQVTAYLVGEVIRIDVKPRKKQ